MKLTYIALATLALMGANQSAFAGDKTFGDGSLPDFLKPFDVNENGKLEEAERQAAKAALKEKAKERHEDFLTKWDTNKDGKLDADELKAARDSQKLKIEELRTKRFNDADKSGNGELDKLEFSATVPTGHLPAGAVNLIFARLDGDSSGGITLAEFTAGCGPRPPAGGGGGGGVVPGLLEWLRPFDLNRNGILEPAENEALQAAIRAGAVVPPVR